MSFENWKYINSVNECFDGGYDYEFLKEENEKVFVDTVNSPHKRFLIQYEGFGCGNKDYTDFVLKDLM